MSCRRTTEAAAALACALLLGCATPTPPDAQGWAPQSLPGKASTEYRWTTHGGRPALQATSNGSASLWRKRLNPAIEAPTLVRFSMWIDDLVPDASVGDATAEDAPARVVFGFEGDRQRLSARNRALFDLAETLTGEAPPYATLMYVWDAKLPVGTVVVNHRTDRIRKIVVESGAQFRGQWRDHERRLQDDFKRAFGEEPGRLSSVAVMTDSDNTRSQARAWYGVVGWE